METQANNNPREKATFLQRPMLLLRECTERPDALTQGAVFFMGTEPEEVLNWTEDILVKPLLRSMASTCFGDGASALLMRNTLETWVARS